MGLFNIFRSNPSSNRNIKIDKIRDIDVKLILKAEEDIKTVKSLIKSGANVNCKDEFGRTPVQAAAARGKSKVLKFLIDSGGKVDTRDENGTLPLYEAIIGNELALSWYGARGPQLKNIQVLINAGADVNAVCHDETLLEFAKRLDETKVVKMLKDAGAK
jgi:ankyrin repeat protein